MITMITGGTGAGKTAYALRLAEEYKSKTYLATAVCIDDEMRAKIKAHIEERDETYTTVEEPLEIADVISGGFDSDILIIDCITFWINNIIYHQKNEKAYCEKLISSLSSVALPVVIVTNEVGLGIISGDSETRKYAKVLAKINKELAKVSDNVYMMVSGLPLKVK